MVYLESPSTDPRFNLALEEYVFEKMTRSQAYFMLWQNDNAVICGKYQNSAREVDMQVVDELGIKVVRRLSGGGAVYHDLGNINFTIIVDAGDAKHLDFDFFATPLINTLKTFGVEAKATGRNDITVDGAKFSGNAQYNKNGRYMHHGTILFDSDLSVVGKVLKPREDKFTDKAVKSVRSRVTNLKPYLGDEVGLEEMKKAFAAEMDRANGLVPYQFSQADIEGAEAIAAGRYNTWEWNFGKSPKFEVEKQRRIEGVGSIEMHYTLENGVIRDYRTYGDYFGAGDAEEFRQRMVGLKASPEALREALADVDIGLYYHNLQLEDFIRLVVE